MAPLPERPESGRSSLDERLNDVHAALPELKPELRESSPSLWPEGYPYGAISGRSGRSARSQRPPVSHRRHDRAELMAVACGGAVAALLFMRALDRVVRHA